MTLDQRIKQDIGELFQKKEISAAKALAPAIQVSTRGLPQHFVGDRAAKTIFVMLNPGQDAAAADARFATATKDYASTSLKAFVESYVADKTEFGVRDRERPDSFDVKQAAFLKAWTGSGVKLPARFPADRATHLAAKAAVLSQKLQLELIPYCSRTFIVSAKTAKALVPFVETLLDEIFAKPRRYVIFGSGLFERVFKTYNHAIGKTVFDLSTDKRRMPLKSFCGSCRSVTIRLDGQLQKALVAHTFSNQALSRAYAIMERYGAFCHEQFGHA